MGRSGAKLLLDLLQQSLMISMMARLLVGLGLPALRRLTARIGP